MKINDYMQMTTEQYTRTGEHGPSKRGGEGGRVGAALASITLGSAVKNILQKEVGRGCC